MYRIFIIEDDVDICESVSKQLALWDIECKSVDNYRNVTAEFASFDPHMALIDITLPFFNGYHWCGEIRKISNAPIIFISSASDNLNIVMAMNMGADDFIAKPFDGSVLMAKVQALLRRSYDFTSSAPVLSHRGAFLNTGDNVLLYGDARIPLSRNEYRILACLLENKGKIVSRDTLMTKLWQNDLYVEENTLTVNVGRLRKKLEDAGLCDLILTKPGSGYMAQ